MSNMDWTDLLMGSGLRVGYNASDLKKTCKCRCVFFPNFYHHSAIRKKLEKTLILAFEAKSIRFSSSIIFFVKSYFRHFFFKYYIQMALFSDFRALCWRSSFTLRSSCGCRQQFLHLLGANGIPRYLTKLIWKSCCVLYLKKNGLDHHSWHTWTLLINFGSSLL